jgi:hypothetical protein
MAIARALDTWTSSIIDRRLPTRAKLMRANVPGRSAGG